MTTTGKPRRLFDGDSKYSLEEQIGLLADVTQSFASSLDIQETLENAIERFKHYLDAEAASIFLLEDDNREIVCRACAGPVDITGMRMAANTGIVGKAIERRCCQIVRDVRSDPDFTGAFDKRTGFVTRSILCTPLTIRGDCIGALQLINKLGGDGLFDEQDQHVLGVLASAAALAINNARMADRLLEQERIRRELELAREIQLGLLPAARDDDFPIAGLNVPARGVSGDFYDFFEREDGLIYFNLADVSGKGMNAALLMARVSSLLHHLAKEIDDPGILLSRVNRELCESASHGMFVTIVTGFLDADSRTARLSNAGHIPPLVYRGGGAFEEIPAAAPPLGIDADFEFPVVPVRLDGASMYLFTDGVTESLGADNASLEQAGVAALIESGRTAPPRVQLERIVAELRREGEGLRDDITLMLIQCPAA
jgi:sigma-B regulation protein RsbU (phosphoserine phosphatase)